MTKELVLLTGGTGFLGYAILVELLKNGYRVRVAARSQTKIDKVLAASSIAALNPPTTQLTFVIVPDMSDAGAYNDAVQGVDFIIHTAAPVHSVVPKEKLHEMFVRDTVNGNLGILKSAMEKGKAVKRVVMTSSTVAIAPPDILLKDSNDRHIVRGPETRVTIPAPPYKSYLQAYSVGKAAALNAAESFVQDNATAFDLISIMPSWVFGKDELVTDLKDLPSNSSTSVMVGGLLTGDRGLGAVGNAILCSDVAKAHVRSLDPNITGSQSFLLSTEVNWDETGPIAKKHFPDAFKSGLFCEGSGQPTWPIRWDSSKAREILGIDLASQDLIVKEVVGHYMELKERELQ